MFKFEFDNFTQRCWEELPAILKSYMLKNEKYLQKNSFIKNNIRILWTLYNHIVKKYSKVSSTTELSIISKVHNLKMLAIQNYLFDIGLLKRHFLSSRFFMGCSFNDEVCETLSIPKDGYHIFIFKYQNKRQTFDPNEEWIKLPNFIKKKEINILTPVFFKFTNSLLKELQKPQNKRLNFFRDNSCPNNLNTLVENSIIFKITKPIKNKMINQYNLTDDAEKNLIKEKWGIYSDIL